MPESTNPGHSRLDSKHKISIAGIAALGAAALALSVFPGTGQSESAAAAEPVAFAANISTKTVSQSISKQQVTADKQAKDAAKAKATADAKAKAAAEAKKRDEAAAASRSAARKPVYANNLDGWIRQSLDIMKSKGIPGTYDGLHRNIMRESTGNPNAINGWDINAINGIPSKGLLQVIQPTFTAYHVAGTSWNIYDPVANITAAANYAADKYGSMDNVNSAY
ncbi:transglycosylase SLT domain-containing protein [Streptomyces sp. NBC_00083]|uniref:transglycosylase SLT domain-containing protein n=1 Tax=Streptomyces sp. NBC_00083 TaxID=2975647 RepID=UPI0022504A9B|nr:transglycosylase SLT domain-containing protein [Streptomyces sp. NBC_00083]MCX5383252.1 transglycosylase SLT domain-containing protein [Streptomyces sp. NBC_00083]